MISIAAQKTAFAAPTAPSFDVVGFITKAVATHKQRKALRHLTLTQLADMGITEAEADTESKRAFWDI